MKLKAKNNDEINQVPYKYKREVLPYREIEDRKPIIIDIDNVLLDSNNDCSEIIEEINAHRQNKLFEWYDLREVEESILKEPLTNSDVKMIMEKMQNTKIADVVKRHEKELKDESLFKDVEELKIQVKELSAEILKLNDVCAIMSEMIYND